MLGWSRIALGGALLLTLVGTALASEKIIVLKNGWKIRGEIAAETSREYTVKTADGGKVTVAKVNVSSVNDPPPPSKRFLEPDAPGDAPKTSEDQSTPEDAKPTPKPSASTAAPAPGKTLGAAATASPLATAEQIGAAKKALLAIPEAAPDDTNQTAMRQQAIDAFVKATPLSTIVAVAVENADTRGPDRALALELASANPKAAKALLAQAIAGFTLSKGGFEGLRSALQKIGDDDAGTIQATLFARVDAQLAQQYASPGRFYELLEVVATDKCLTTLYARILKANPSEVASAVNAAKAILSRSTNVDAVLAPLLAQIDFTSGKAPPVPTIVAVLDVLSMSQGAAAADAIGRAVQALDGLPPQVDDSLETSRREAIKNGMAALGSIGNRAAADYLMRMFESSSSEERKVAIITQLGRMKRNNFDGFDEFLLQLVDKMSEPSHNETERGALAGALHNLTGQGFGIDPVHWREYILKQSGR